MLSEKKDKKVYYIQKVEKQNKKIAQTLKIQERVIADQYDDVSVLFADIVGFTQYSSEVSPGSLVSKLNEIFFCFDEFIISNTILRVFIPSSKGFIVVFRFLIQAKK